VIPAQVGFCPLCGASPSALFIEHAGNRLARCAACQLVYLDPLPSAATITKLYSDTYSGATESYFTKPKKKLARSLRRARRIASCFEGGASGKCFLDVGASGGFMVEAARRAGFTAFGVEPDGPAVEYARQHYPANRYFQGFAGSVDFGDLRFDAIYCSEVIEHAPDCHDFMGALARLCRPGGVLYLTTPDISHWRVPRDIRKWDAFCPPAHCLYFSPGNLHGLLARHGFDVMTKWLAFKPGIKFLARRLPEASVTKAGAIPP
jgi:2-polyprenyl-3-methyl-5-hydroxy-6-metoxy-1,4-benzoquinol methylase